jgi:hypothetical protein
MKIDCERLRSGTKSEGLFNNQNVYHIIIKLKRLIGSDRELDSRPFTTRLGIPMVDLVPRPPAWREGDGVV